MKPGWLKARLIRRRTRKLSDETLSQIGSLLKDNPRLTIEEALGVIDKNKTIFFPGEHRRQPDLKTGFASVVWKTYRCRYSADPPAATDEHRAIVFDAAYRYLNRGNIDEGSNFPGIKTWRKAQTRPAKLMVAFGIPAFIIAVALGGVLSQITQ